MQLAFIGWLCVLITGCSSLFNAPEFSLSNNTEEINTEPHLSPEPTTIPQHYNEYTVKLDIQPSENLITGVERIKIFNTSKRVLNKVYINLPLNAFSEHTEKQPVLDELFDRVYPQGRDYGYIKINNVYVEGEEVNYGVIDTVLNVDLPQALPPEERMELKMELEAKIPSINHRTGSDENSMWFGNFMPLLAVCDDEGWHAEPYYPIGDPFYARTANFYVSITTPPEYTVVGPGIPLITDKDDKRTAEFSSKLIRDFAFAISRLYTVQHITTPSNVEISLYTFSDNVRKDALLDLASRCLEYYSHRVGAYPYSQLIIAETKLFIEGGIGYPGVIFIDSDYLSATEDFTSVSQEIGHQWFYNIIGSNQIDYAWMDEGLAGFVKEGFLLNDSELDSKMYEEYTNLQYIITQISPNILNSSLGEFESWSDYYNIHHQRGKLMFHSLYKKIGKENFNAFLLEYNKRFSFRIAAPKDLMQTAEDVSGKALGEFFNTWINNPILPPLQ